MNAAKAKCWILGLCLSIVSISVIPIKVHAKENTIKLSVQGAEEVSQGEQFTVAVHTESAAKVMMAQFELCYDSSKVSLSQATAGEMLQSAPTVNTAEEGRVFYAWESLDGFVPNGDWLYCTFQVKAGAGNVLFWIDAEKDLIFADDSLVDFKVELEALETAIVPESSPEPAASDKGSAEDTETGRQTASGAEEGSDDGLKLNLHKAELKDGEVVQLEVADEGAALIWESSNEAVASVEGGKVVTHGAGTTVITALSEDGLKSATCVINVEAAEASSGTSSVSDLGQTDSADAEADQTSGQSASPPYLAEAAVLVACLAAVCIIFVRRSHRYPYQNKKERGKEDDGNE